MAKTFTAKNFEEEVLNSEIPVLVDFWASWCGPCQMMGPIIDKLADKYEGKIKIGKLSVEDSENQELAGHYGIQSIPAFKIFKQGQVVLEFVGGKSEEWLKTELDKFL